MEPVVQQIPMSLMSTLGVGMVVLGAGLGIGKLAAAAMEGISRQPEAADKIRGAMILAIAMIEGVALFGLIICLIDIFKG